MILVVGGAGYIGSHTAYRLLDKGYDIAIFDNLSRGHDDLRPDCPFFRGELANPGDINQCFDRYDISDVMLFSAHSQVGESSKNPFIYYQNNIAATLNLLEVMINRDVRRLVFSSSAAVYGQPTTTVLTEDHPLSPLSPYGRSKAMFEAILADFDTAYGMSSLSLRYFNAAGADPDGRTGERHLPETHLIPLALGSLLGLYPRLTVFGDDYDTPDGTCIRDYIHVQDIADAHIAAVDYLRQDGATDVINLGTGSGNSVKEVMDAVSDVTGQALPFTLGARRDGDPSLLVASNEKAKSILGWTPLYVDIRSIISDAWAWQKKDVDKLKQCIADRGLA